MNYEEIDQKKVEKEKELKEAQQNLHTIEIEELEIAKQIVNLQAKRKDLQIAISKAKHIAKNLSLEVKILTSEFWRAKNQ